MTAGVSQVKRQTAPHPMAAGLVVWWPLDTLVPSVDTIGGHPLTQRMGIPTLVAGKVGSAVHFAAASTQGLTCSGGGTFKGAKAALYGGDTDFSIAFWAYLDSTGADRAAVCKWDTVSQFCEYAVIFANAANRFRFQVSTDGITVASSVDATSFGAPSIATWYFIVAWHDSYGNTLNIQVNNGTVDSTSYSGGVANFYGVAGNASPLNLGQFDDPASYWDGSLDEMAFYRRVLTPSMRTWLYNDGLGRTYPFTSQA